MKNAFWWLGTTISGIAILFFLYWGLVMLNSIELDQEVGREPFIVVSILSFILMAGSIWVLVQRIRNRPRNERSS